MDGSAIFHFHAHGHIELLRKIIAPCQSSARSGPGYTPRHHAELRRSSIPRGGCTEKEDFGARYASLPTAQSKKHYTHGRAIKKNFSHVIIQNNMCTVKTTITLFFEMTMIFEFSTLLS